MDGCNGMNGLQSYYYKAHCLYIETNSMCAHQAADEMCCATKMRTTAATKRLAVGSLLQ